ncbi:MULTISPECIES: nucleoside permease [Chryseobacterium]|uniref:NHS family xanthosine MFS transporter n=1 Tax=Chryseobacterium camelliae TaxID=1265445 RepID=A0ABU0TH09_9FLAO|nr:MULTISPECIES: nucleoside permease [Chryseobacterium]MDT3405851.1 NHS family xanthosine MFS transporter [Pseudacidovorax intermedius]MDQ1096342.1 NHS family xanthosine MFS transporter [Chryseobacterium camelliae]MDQ1100281.1 NHS family xanthosine MFS transporter [Chryseobacterium sp. SORGH_AS_1048]MDR6087624.1 NHS family xanthosine MFS transporter [Chryseobacterium sp. SORGH_AS_0909]MDR6131998.1 NHS family xanthosine MFS transporter [Chryseobacterium sp. SORGH_AS_1175]
MNLKLRLTILSFLQFFVWGAWLITMANFWFGTKHWDGTQFGAVFGTMGIASIFMPTITGIIADRWVNAERIFSVLHILYGVVLFILPHTMTPDSFFYVMLLAMCFYMPTIALANSISYTILKNSDLDVVKDFPPIRVWGTVGFIVAMWITNLTGNKATEGQFYIAGAVAVFLGIYALTLPKCPPQKLIDQNAPLYQQLGLNAFKLFANYKTALFLLFSMLLGAALQLTNAYGDVFLSEFEHFPKYADSFVVQRSTIIMSISQVSETLFILAIPFFLKKFGIKKVMLMSMLAWVLRFGFFAYGIPEGFGLMLIIASCIVYGMAFDFFNISGSLFVETTTDKKIRSSAQGLFMMMTNGFGAVLGSYIAGWAIDRFFTHKFTSVSELSAYLQTTPDNPTFLGILKKSFNAAVNPDGTLSSIVMVKDWHQIWLSFAVYALVLAILFAVLFRHKHHPEDISEVKH